MGQGDDASQGGSATREEQEQEFVRVIAVIEFELHICVEIFISI